MTFCGDGAFGNRDHGSCPRDKPYCDDSGYCRVDKLENYTGVNEAFNSKFYLILYIVLGIVGLIIAFFVYKNFIKK